MAKASRPTVAGLAEQVEAIVAELHVLHMLHHPKMSGETAVVVVADDGEEALVAVSDPWRKMVLRELRLLRSTVEVQDQLIRRLITSKAERRVPAPKAKGKR